MAISTYSELKTAVSNWMHRSDLTDRLDEFIDLAEARLSRDLRINQLTLRTTSAATDEYHALPSDFLSAVELRLDTAGGKTLRYMPTDQISQKYPEVPSGEPEAYDVVGQYLRIVPVNANGYTIDITYRAKLPALSDSNTTNYVLTMHPDAYLWACCIEASDYIGDEKRMARAMARYQDTVRQIRHSNFMAGSNPAVRVE